MCKILLFLIVFVIGEMLASFIFLWLDHIFVKEPHKIKDYQRIELFKGILERFLLFLAFTSNIFMILVFLGAIKLGTRLETDKTN